MKKVFVNVENQEVKLFNETKQTYETCNFYEAGLDGITDEDEIKEHLEERESNDGEIEVEVIFQ